MSLPYELTQHDPQLVHYLLGLLPEEEAERLDEASIVDHQVASQLRGVEDDLVDAYVTETLDGDTRDHFEAFYLKSPHRREKVKFARRFLTVVDRAAAANSPVAVAVGAGSDRVRRFTPRPATSKPAARRSRFSWPMLTTAASLVLACGLIVKDLQWRQGSKQAERQDVAVAQDRRAETLARQLDEARNESAQIAQALESARAAAAPPRERPSAAMPSTASKRSASVATKAAVLFPQTRSTGQPPTVELPSGARDVRFELRLESNEFDQFRTLLRDPATDRIVWRSSALSARSTASSVVPVVVPSSVLTARHYSFELAGINVAGRETTIANYAFQVDRQ